MKQTGKMKKIMFQTVAAIMACTTIGSLAACGSTPPPTVGGGHSGSGVVFEIPEGGYDGSKQTVNFYHTMGSNLRDELDKAIVEFNKLYPNIKIEHEQVGNYDDVRNRISTELTVGNHPSIAYCYPDHVALYNMYKAVITLDNIMDSEIPVTNTAGTEVLGYTQAQKDDFIEAYLNEGKAYGDDMMYTLPLSKSTELLYYDKDFFTEHNLSVPTTWDEMEAVCAQIKEIDPNSIPLGYDSEANWFITMCEQQGSPYTSSDPANRFLFNVEENHAFVARFAEWYEKGYLTTSELYGQYTSNLFKNVGGQRAYMCIGSSAGATHQRPGKDAEGNYLFDVGITSIPQLNPENPKVISQGPSICIFNDSNKQEVLASWLFAKFLTTDVFFQADFANASGYVPVIKSVENDPIYAEDLAKANGGDYIAQLAIKTCLEQKDAYYVSPAFNGSSVARDQVGLLMQECLVDAAHNADKKADMNYISRKFAEYVDKCIYLA